MELEMKVDLMNPFAVFEQAQEFVQVCGGKKVSDARVGVNCQCFSRFRLWC